MSNNIYTPFLLHQVMAADDDEEPRQVVRGSMDHSLEQMKDSYAGKGDEDGKVTFAGGITLNVSNAGNYEVVEPEDDDDEEYHDSDDDSHDDGFNPNEENWEAEDMAGDNADEREEAYDNHDWDAADG